MLVWVINDLPTLVGSTPSQKPGEGVSADIVGPGTSDKGNAVEVTKETLDSRRAATLDGTILPGIPDYSPVRGSSSRVVFADVLTTNDEGNKLLLFVHVIVF